jgi:2'-5' RNA ligase
MNANENRRAGAAAGPRDADPHPATAGSAGASRGPVTRCFAAIALPADVRNAIAPLLAPEGRSLGVSWVPAENLHITMRFFGDLYDLQIAAVRTALRDASAAVRAFELQLGAAGRFPPGSPRPRVYWLGVIDPAGGCASWQARAAPALDALGFPPERDKFTPHITLARSRDRAGGDALRARLESGQTPPPIRWRVDEITLFASRQTPAGVRYERIDAFPLQPAA